MSLGDGESRRFLRNYFRMGGFVYVEKEMGYAR